MRIESIIIGKDKIERKLITVTKDKSIVFIGYKGIASDFQSNAPESTETGQGDLI